MNDEDAMAFLEDYATDPKEGYYPIGWAVDKIKSQSTEGAIMRDTLNHIAGLRGPYMVDGVGLAQSGLEALDRVSGRQSDG